MSIPKEELEDNFEDNSNEEYKEDCTRCGRSGSVLEDPEDVYLMHDQDEFKKYVVSCKKCRELYCYYCARYWRGNKYTNGYSICINCMFIDYSDSHSGDGY